MAGDAGNAVLGVIIEQAIKPVFDAIGRHLGYLFCYKSNIKNLAKTAAQLEKSGMDAENVFKGQRRNNEKPAQASVGWLDEVKELMKDAKQIEEDTDKLKGCLNIKGRYVMSRKSTKLAAGIQKLKSKAPQGITANTVLPAGSLPGALANEASKGYKTRMQTLDEVMVALEDPAIRFIGLCGMGGVGKTTMLHEVRERVRTQNLFDETAMSTVSQNIDLFKIQADLAEMLGLNALKEVKNVIARADQLRLRLTGGNKVLIILDDVWSGFKLEDVGIQSEHKECKVIVTSRQEGVCIDIQKNIKVHALDKEEGRALFRKTAGEHVEKNNLGEIADEVADECEGLPIALLTVSSALSNKHRRAWEDALMQLRGGHFKGIKGMEQYVYQSIKLSYDFLAKEKLEEAQSLLQLCCQHEEDAVINLKKLARYCLSLDLFEGVTGVVQARNRVYSLVEHLKSCFLLLAVADGDEDIERVKVHDVVRDVCRSIASEERDRVCMHIWNQEDDAGIGGTDLDHQKLKLLVDVPFHLTDHLPGIKSFLEQTQEMRVLESAVFIGRHNDMFEQSAELSLAPQFSTSLRMLSLEHTNVYPGVMSELVRLTGLVVLSFMGSTLLSFPHQIGQLRELKLLDLRCRYSFSDRIIPIPSGILPKLTKLEVLFMGTHYFPKASYSVGEGDVEKESCPGSIEELDSLTNLTTLQVNLLDPTQLLDLKCFPFDNLKGFSFCCSVKSSSFNYQDDLYPLHKKNICLKDVRMNWIVGDKIQSIVKSTVDLSLCDIEDLTDTSILKRFASLKILELIRCHQLEQIIHDGSSAAFVNLETLKIKEMRKVRELCHNGHLPEGLLYLEIDGLPEMTHLWVGHTDPLCLLNLKVVGIQECGALKFIFPHSAAKCLSQLQKLFVSRCGMLNGIFSNSEEGNSTGKGGEITQESNDLLIHLPKLEHFTIFGSLNLQGFLNPDDGRGQSIINPKVMLPSIKYLNVCENDSIKAVFDFEGLEAMTMREDERLLLCEPRKINLRDLLKLAHLCRQVPKDVPIFQNLGELRVEGCHSLAYLIPCSIARMLVNLQELTVEDCTGMKEVISKMNEKEEEDYGELEKNIVFRSLTEVTLKGLENLSSFCSSDQQVFEFPSLEKLQIIKCPELKTFCCQIPRVAPSRMLEENVNKREASTAAGGGEIDIHCNQAKIKMDPSDLAALFPKLKKVRIEDTPNFRGFYNIERYQVLVMLPSIEYLYVHDINSMKALFDFEGLEAVREDERLLLCKLDSIELWWLPKLEHLCRQVPKDVVIFQNLATLEVNLCHNLPYLFPSSIARMLVNLRILCVKRCKGMKEVISKTNEEEDCGELEKNIVFPSVIYIRLHDLENMSSFCSSDQQVFEFPSLEELSISQCPEIETFCCQIPRVAPSRMLEENVNKGEASTAAAAGGGEIDIHCNQAEIKMDPSDLAALFPKLKIVSIKYTPNFQGFYNIERHQVLVNLKVRASYQLKQMVEVGGDNLVSVAASTSLTLVQNLKHIILTKCEAMKALLDFDGFEVTREDAHSVFNSLETIRLRQLPNLEHICRLIPKEVNGFHNLRSLHVYGCDSLSYLLTSTMAHMLLNLKFLVVWNSKSMKEVIKRDEDCGPNKIVFRSLHSVVLNSEKLSSFCSSELQEFDFPSLSLLLIGKCPAMTTFCCGHLTAEKLGGVAFVDDFNKNEDNFASTNFDDSDLQYDDDDDDDDDDDGNNNIFWKGDVNETICRFNSRASRLKRDLKEDGVDDKGADKAEEEDGDGVGALSRNDRKDTAQHLNARVSQISLDVREDDVGDKDAEDVDDIRVPKEGVDNEYDQCGNEASSSKPTKELSTPLVGSSPDASLVPVIVCASPPFMSNNDEELSHVNDILPSASIELSVPSSDSPVRHFYARDDNQNSDLKEDGVDNSATVDVDIDENVQCNNEALDHSGTSRSTPLDQGTSSEPTKALLAPLILSSLDPLLAPVFASPLPPASDSNQVLAYSSIPDLGNVEFIPSSLSEQSIPSSDSPMQTTADEKLSNSSLSIFDNDSKGSRVLIQGVYIKSEMKITFEEILTANPKFLSGLRFKKAETKTMFVESAISSLQSLGQYTARTMSEEQLTCIKDSLDDLVASGLDMAWLLRGYKRASLVMKERKAVLAANELARLDRKKVEAEAAFEIAKAQLEQVMALRDASKSQCDALFQQVEEGKDLFGGGFDQDTSLGHGLLY